jgi:Spx/MgsR family transcriptional regulator
MVTLYGIKNCDTVKKARKWLEAQGIDYQFHDFRADGLSADQVDGWLSELGATALVNKRSTTWKQLTEAQQQQALSASAAELICAHPTLIKRPLLDTGSARLVGFSAAQYEQINW